MQRSSFSRSRRKNPEVLIGQIGRERGFTVSGF
jgi:hypothetical protein